MPTIEQASVPVAEFPDQFSSPYGNDGIVPLYSSIPLKSPVSGCLPCVVCGNSVVRGQAIASASQSNNGANGVNGTAGSGTKVVISPSSPNFLSVTKKQDVTSQFPGSLVHWTVTITNLGEEDRFSVEIPNDFGGAALVSSNYPYLTGGFFRIDTIPSKASVTLTYVTKMPCDMMSSITDVTSVSKSGVFTGVVRPAFTPTLIYRANYPYDWSDPSNFYLVSGAPAGRVPTTNDNVFVQSSIWSGTPNSRQILASGTILMGSGNPVQPSSITTAEGLILCCGVTCQVPNVYGPVYIYSDAHCESATLHGPTNLYETGYFSGGVTVNANVTMHNSSHIDYANTINGNLSMYDSSYHYPGNSNQLLTINGNLDAYYPVPKPVARVSVSGATTYHNYP